MDTNLSRTSQTTVESDSIAPEKVHAFLASPNIIALRIDANQVVWGEQVPYKPEEGDQIRNGQTLARDGKAIGIITGTNQDMFRPFDRLDGQRLNTDWADRSESYLIRSPEDNDFLDGISPTAVYRKSKPMAMAQTGPWNFDWDMVHTIFLELPSALTEGQTYTIDFQGQLIDIEIPYKPEEIRSEAIHVSHLGFDPDDSGKVAFLSTWMGNGGALDYDEGLNFWLIDEATGEKVYSGTTSLSQPKEEEEDFRKRNYNSTDVYLMDFSDFQTPGEYRVYVDGIGTSFPFLINEKTWEDAFYVSARGMYHQRSGIALEQPYTNWERPRDFHPDDGVKIYEITVSLMEGTEGLGLAGIGPRQLEQNLALDGSGELIEVKNAWGGWHDAGDSDRRIQHLEVSRSFLEMVEMFPDYFQTVNLNIPESGNDLADIMDEALWGVDFFMRLQTPEGGIRGGIENPHNNWWGSWQWDVAWAYEPDMWSSFIYAGVAARAAYLLADYDSERAATYQASAIKAMEWAELEYANYDGSLGNLPHVINDERNLAAAELYRLTGDEQWHNLFLETTAFTDPNTSAFVNNSHNQEEAAFVYARTQPDDIREDIRTNAINALVKDANWHTDIVNNNYGFKFNKHPWAPVGWGSTIGAPNTSVMLRAHALTGNDAYLEASVLATQFMAGANPDNMVYTTGLGYRSPQDPLLVDRRALGTQDIPPGITIYGPIDMQAYGWHWSNNLFQDVLFPNAFQWPTTGEIVDVFFHIPVSEFTVMQSIAPTAYTWGYLAAIDFDIDVHGESLASVVGNQFPGDNSSFDIDGDGEYLASVDGLLFYGYLNIRNLPSPELVNSLTQELADNLINPQGNATRKTGAEIAQYLESNPEMMDIDGDENISASIDGLLAHGYLNIRNLPSQDLVNSSIQELANNLIPNDSGAIRTSGPDISAFIEGYI